MADPSDANPSDNGPLPRNHPPAATTAVARHPGHELPFVTPSTYLHLRAPTAPATSATATAVAIGTSRPLLASAAASNSSAAPQPQTQISHTMAAPESAQTQKPLMTPLDRDQMQGLVSNRRPFWATDSDRVAHLPRAFHPLPRLDPLNPPRDAHPSA